MPAAIARRSPFKPRRAAFIMASSRASVAWSVLGVYGNEINMMEVYQVFDFFTKKIKVFRDPSADS